jgi:hypothetical protein
MEGGPARNTARSLTNRVDTLSPHGRKEFEGCRNWQRQEKLQCGLLLPDHAFEQTPATVNCQLSSPPAVGIFRKRSVFLAWKAQPLSRRLLDGCLQEDVTSNQIFIKAELVGIKMSWTESQRQDASGQVLCSTRAVKSSALERDSLCWCVDQIDKAYTIKSGEQ